MSEEANDESKFLAITKWITEKAIVGVPPLTSSANLAQEYLLDHSYSDLDTRVDALIRWEATKNFTSGFVTGLGGILTLPVAVPSALGASWALQARMAGAIAEMYGHSTKEDRIRTLVLLSLVGNSIKDIFKEVGVTVGRKALEKALRQIPGRVLIEINKKVGFRLLTKAGEKGAINLLKMVPIAGGLVGGGFDASACYAVGKVAKSIFRP